MDRTISSEGGVEKERMSRNTPRKQSLGGEKVGTFLDGPVHARVGFGRWKPESRAASKVNLRSAMGIMPDMAWENLP